MTRVQKTVEEKPFLVVSMSGDAAAGSFMTETTVSANKKVSATDDVEDSP